MRPQMPMSVTACVIYSGDAKGIRAEMLEIAREGLRVVLNAEQVGVLVAESKSLYDSLDESRAFDTGK